MNKMKMAKIVFKVMTLRNCNDEIKEGFSEGEKIFLFLLGISLITLGFVGLTQIIIKYGVMNFI